MSSQRARIGRRPTQTDVAREAGVSQALVSYVLNDAPVPEATRRRILDVVRDLGYVPHRAARALRLDQTMTLALVIPDITNPFYPAVQRGLQDSTEAAGYQLITYNTDGVADKERNALRSIRETRADGAVIFDFHLAADDYRSLLDVGTALAMVTAIPSKLGDLLIDRVIVDDRGGAARMTRYLIERGYPTIGHIAGAPDSVVGRMRLDAFRAECTAAGVDVDPAHVAEADFTFAGGRRAMAALLALDHPPAAVFAANDLMALGALEACHAEGVRVPADVAIAGFDDIEASRMVAPALTTVVQPQRLLGHEVGRLLVERLTGEPKAPVRETAIGLDLAIRESA